jgi:hypothetical protein
MRNLIKQMLNEMADRQQDKILNYLTKRYVGEYDGFKIDRFYPKQTKERNPRKGILMKVIYTPGYNEVEVFKKVRQIRQEAEDYLGITIGVTYVYRPPEYVFENSLEMAGRQGRTEKIWRYLFKQLFDTKFAVYVAKYNNYDHRTDSFYIEIEPSAIIVKDEGIHPCVYVVFNYPELKGDAARVSFTLNDELELEWKVQPMLENLGIVARVFPYHNSIEPLKKRTKGQRLFIITKDGKEYGKLPT